MPPTRNSSKRKEKVTALTDKFVIKNFVLSDSSAIPVVQSFEESLLFDGVIFSICLKGSATFKLNYRELTIGKDAIFTCMPNQIFRLISKSNDFIMESLFLSADYVLQLPLPKDLNLLKKMGSDPIQKVGTEALHNMLELHSLIAKYHSKENNAYKELQTKALIFALLIEIGSVYSATMPDVSKAVSRQEMLTEEFFKLLLENYKKERSVAFYADLLYLTPKYLSMTIKNVTGHPISSWINEAVIIEIKKMLKATDMTALQISEELNFPNPSFFGKFFKQYTGMTPLQYKSS